MPFQGIEPIFHSLITGALVLIVLVVSWWSYRSPSPLPNLIRYSLMGLRASALIILLILLINPFFEREERVLSDPVVAVYLDDSRSMSVNRGEYRGRETYEEILGELLDHWPDHLGVEFYGFSGQVTSLDEPELNLEGVSTDLDRVLRHTSQLSDEVVAVVLFSDGIVTRGRDPVFEAANVQIPLFTVPVGDTTRIQDVAVQDVWASDRVPAGTRQRIEVAVRHEGFDGASTPLRLYQDQEVVDEQTASFEGERGVSRYHFDVQFDQEGTHQLSAIIEPLDGELTTENNEYPFTIEVVDETRHIMHLSFLIHPDVAAMRSILQRDPSIDLQTYTWTGNQFIEGDPDPVTNEPDLIIIHGNPPEEVDPDIWTSRPFSMLYATLPGSNNELFSPLGIEPGDHSPMSPGMSPEEPGHPVLDGLPPLSETRPMVTGVLVERLPSEMTALLEGATNEYDPVPILMVADRQESRLGLLGAYNWYRYRQTADADTREFYEQLIRQLAGWLASAEDDRAIEVNPIKVSFQEDEDVEFLARLRQEATGAGISDAVIELTITDGESERITHLFTHQGDGHYRLDAGSLPEGVYQYRADVQRNGETLESIEGEFTVLSSPLELLDTRRNDELLRALSRESGGEFIESFGENQLQEVLSDRQLLDRKEEIIQDSSFARHSPAWFILVLLLLSTEWVTRKYYGHA